MSPLKKYIGLKRKISIIFSIIFLFLGLCFNSWDYRRIKGLLISNHDWYLTTKAGEEITKPDTGRCIAYIREDTLLQKRIGARTDTSVTCTIAGFPDLTKLKPGITDTLGYRFALVESNNPAKKQLIVFGLKNSKLYAHLSTILYWLVLSTILSAVLAGVLFYFTLRLILSPLQLLIERVKNFTATHSPQPLHLQPAGDELYELTSSINGMMKRIEDSIRQQQGFFASASHELKTPLAILRTELEVRLAKPDADTHNSVFLRNQLEEIVRLQDVVNHFLVVSQARTGSLSIFCQPFDIMLLLLQVFERLQPILHKTRLIPTLHFDNEIAGKLINADKDMLRIVLMNLLTNCTKYGIPGSRLNCTVSASGETNQLSIQITNAIEEESLNTDKLRNAFVRGSVSGEGSGLGLWLANEIITQHNGKLKILSIDQTFTAIILIPGLQAADELVMKENNVQ
ncbi:HAMP domain-containing histidine kinase [Terrimonas sp. NA20]|uniref:histidine kinase n=1 Tax=Terrimonas ginsenosidimutans TaxID=2908004 RepID=A0ABS9KVB0_9BACT|nr:ATP-binding protein [Terrimonas ginsenosidimutans]MCG2616266.1 HAMP domain-containing histidine kinase [Terrimonas ginsenosidimutans]